MNHIASSPAPRSLARALLLTALLLAPTAHALPIVEHLDLQVGGERFLRVPPSPRVRVEPEGLITFEALPSREAFVVAQKPGRGLLFVASDAENIFQVVSLRIHAPGEPIPKRDSVPSELDAAQRACPTLTLQTTRHGQELEAEVKTLECRAALLALLRDDAFVRRNVAFSFTGDLLREQLAIIEKRLTAAGLSDAFQLFYRGATLVIRGKGTSAQRLSLYQIAWEETVGSFLFEDQSERLPDPEIKAAPQPEIPAPQASEIRVQTIEEIEKENPELLKTTNHQPSKQTIQTAK